MKHKKPKNLGHLGYLENYELMQIGKLVKLCDHGGFDHRNKKLLGNCNERIFCIKLISSY